MFGTLAQEQKKIKKQKKKSAEAKLLEAVGNELDDVDDDVTVESIAPDTTGMNEAALQKLVERQSPELVALLQEFIDQLTKLRQSKQLAESGDKHAELGCCRGATAHEEHSE